MRKLFYRIFNLGSREEGEIGSESREKGDLPPVPSPSRIIISK